MHLAAFQTRNTPMSKLKHLLSVLLTITACRAATQSGSRVRSANTYPAAALRAISLSPNSIALKSSYFHKTTHCRRRFISGAADASRRRKSSTMTVSATTTPSRTASTSMTAWKPCAWSSTRQWPYLQPTACATGCRQSRRTGYPRPAGDSGQQRIGRRWGGLRRCDT